MSHPQSRRARALRALGITVIVIGAIVAFPVLLTMMFAGTSDRRR